MASLTEITTFCDECEIAYKNGHCPICGDGPKRWRCEQCGFAYDLSLDDCPDCGGCDAMLITTKAEGKA